MSLLGVYDTLTRLLAPVRPAVLAWRSLKGKEDPRRRGERLGQPSRERPAGPLIWLHGASIGEGLAALAVIDRLLDRRPQPSILVTTGTRTAAAVLAERLPATAIHQYVPLDQPGPVRRFLAYWQPDLAIWLESELWPNLLQRLRARGTPMVLLNARMSESSFQRWQRARPAARTLLGCFDVVLAQSGASADRLRSLAPQPVTAHPNLKYAAAPLPDRPGDRQPLARAIGGRRVWIAASTHPDDEGPVLAAHAALREQDPELLLIVAPRHPSRAAPIAHAASQTGLTPMLRSNAKLSPNADTAVYIADTVGELGVLYRLAALAYVGGALPARGASHGGQNPLEAAALGLPVLFGPEMTNFTEIADRLTRAGAAETVTSAEALAHAAARLLADGQRRRTMGEAARTAAQAQRTAILDTVMDAMAGYLPGDSPAAAPTGAAPEAVASRPA